MLGRVGLAVGADDGVRPEDGLGQFPVHGDDAQGRLVAPRGPDRGAAEQDAVARPDDHHGIIAPPLDEPVAVRRDLPRVDVARVGRHETDHGAFGGSRGDRLEVPADLAPQDGGVARVPRSGDDGSADVLFHADRRSTTMPAEGAVGSERGREGGFCFSSLPLDFCPVRYAYPFAGRPVKGEKAGPVLQGQKKIDSGTGAV